jgi:hypothetical protein
VVAAETPGAPLSARDALAIETPASRATSAIVTCPSPLEVMTEA